MNAYKVYRGLSGNRASASLVTTLPGSYMTYTDSALSPGVWYFYWVAACSSSDLCSESSAYATTSAGGNAQLFIRPAAGDRKSTRLNSSHT